MKSSKPRKLDQLERKHPAVARDAMEDIKELTGNPSPVHNDVRYVGANRDRALGEADRTGRHHDEETASAPDEGSVASKEHEAD
jgi:hypothetical protein